MPFTNGRVSFARLAVAPGPAIPGRAITQTQIDRLAEHAFRATDIGAPLETEAGWTSAAHLLDTDLDLASVARADGAAALFGLRIDTNRVPAELRRAVRAEHERALARATPSGLLSRAQRMEARDLAEHALHEELAAGKHRRSTMTQLLWDVPAGILHCAAASGRVIEVLCERWRGTFDSPLAPLSAGALAYRLLAARGLTRAYEDLRPAAFTAAPEAFRVRDAAEHDEGWGDPDVPECPWARSGPEPADFLGNEMLLWLWWLASEREGMVETTLAGGERVDIAIALERTLELECAWGTTGKVTIRDHLGGVAPTRLAEAAHALRTGKLPRRAGLRIAEVTTGEQWQCTFQADRWQVTAGVLPTPDEDLETDDEHAAWRIEKIQRLDALLESLLRAYLAERTAPGWETTRQHVKAWIRAHARPAPATIQEPKPTAVTTP